MNKKCIFDLKKTCNDCGECMICDLDRKKTCDDCGKCLEMEGHDMKEIQIDEVIDDAEDVINLEDKYETKVIENTDTTDTSEDNNEEWALIDDIKGLDEVVEEIRVGDSPEVSGYYEEYPGLIVKKKKIRPEIKRYLN